MIIKDIISIMKKTDNIKKMNPSDYNGVNSHTNQAVNLSENERVILRKIQLDMLKQCIELCERYSILYFAVGGTALGAIRHGGFIPWDDDIDIAMPRTDYEKFLAITRQELPEPLFVQTHETEKEYFLDFAKVRNTETVFWNGLQHE